MKMNMIQVLSLAMLINSTIEQGNRYEITEFFSSLLSDIAINDKELITKYSVNYYKELNSFSFYHYDMYTIFK